MISRGAWYLVSFKPSPYMTCVLLKIKWVLIYQVKIQFETYLDESYVWVWFKKESFKKTNTESATSSHGLLLGHLHIYGVYGQKKWGVWSRCLSSLVHWTNPKCFLTYMESIKFPFLKTDFHKICYS